MIGTAGGPTTTWRAPGARTYHQGPQDTHDPTFYDHESLRANDISQVGTDDNER